MAERPKTMCGKVFAALARRDEQEFVYWRDRVDASESDRADLWATTYQVFRIAVETRFRGSDRTGIVEFLGRRHAPLWVGAELSLREAEALVRSALGERGLVSGIDKKAAVLARMQVFMLVVEDLKLDSTAVDSLVVHAERVVARNKAAE